MATKYPSQDHVQALLKVGNFGATGASDAPANGDPVQETKIVITLDEVKAYDHNPRQSENNRFEEIKASIRQTGRLNTTLNVTRRPGDEQYVISAGGNTRLRALQELYQETGDDRFYRFNAVFQPWESEARVLTDHLIENDLRADLTFVDQALALRKLRRELESERGESLSLRKFETALKKLGYGKSISLLSQMDYAVDVLWPLIPETLATGIGKRQIISLRRLHQAYRDNWMDHTNTDGDNDPHFRAIFEETLKTLDGDAFDLDTFRGVMEARMSDTLGLPGPHYVKFAVENNMKGIADDKFDFRPTLGERELNLVVAPPPDERPDRQTTAAAGADRDRAPGGAPPSGQPPHSQRGDAVSSVAPGADAGAAGQEAPTAPPPMTLAGDGDPDEAPATDLATLRRQACDAARRLAAAVDADLAHCILPHEEGLGYLVDLPGKQIDYRADLSFDERSKLLVQSTTWWLLLTLSEASSLPRAGLPGLPEGYLLGKWWREDPNVIAEQVGPFPSTDIGKVIQNPLLFPALPELFALAEIGQRIRQHAPEDPHVGRSLWPTIFKSTQT